MYTELHAHSHPSLLDGAAAPEALATRAAELGMDARPSPTVGLHGAVKHRNAGRDAGLRPIYGAAVTLDDGGCLTLLVENAAGWADLCRLLSAAGSIVAYVLGITPVAPLAHGLRFERFLAKGSTATPDIDVNAADPREEVIQHVYERYGADRAATVANGRSDGSAAHAQPDRDGSTC